MTMHDEGGVMLMSEERYKTWLWEEPILVGKDSLFFFFWRVLHVGAPSGGVEEQFPQA